MLTFCVTTFGCQMNARDSEKLEGVLEKIGYEKTEREEDADFVIYNTCTVRGKCQSEGVWSPGISRKYQKEKTAYDDRALRLYDAGASCGGKVKEELSFCGFDFWNA